MCVQISKIKKIMLEKENEVISKSAIKVTVGIVTLQVFLVPYYLTHFFRT